MSFHDINQRFYSVGDEVLEHPCSTGLAQGASSTVRGAVRSSGSVGNYTRKRGTGTSLFTLYGVIFRHCVNRNCIKELHLPTSKTDV